MRNHNKILLCGFSRSGTTWLSKIFDSMPTTLLVSEPDKQINKNIKFGKVPHCVDPFHSSEKEIADAYKESIHEIIKFKYCSLRSYPYFRKDYCTVPYYFYNFVSGIYQFMNYLLDRAELNASLKIPDFIFKKETSFDLVWKSVNQSSNIPFLQNTFPDLKIVYVLRNPYSSLASILINNRMKLDGDDLRRIEERKGAIFFKQNDFNLKDIEKWDEFKKRALLWRIDCESAYIAGLENKNFYLVLYEDLVKDPFGVAGNIFKWLDMPFYPETQKFMAQSIGQEDPPLVSRLFSSGYFGVYRKPGIDFTKWKKIMSREDYDRVSPILNRSPLLKFWPGEILSL